MENEPHIIDLDEMIANLKKNVDNLAFYMSNHNRYVRNEAKELIETHWNAIDTIHSMKEMRTD